ncbi:MAG TPA: M56 family metallopeptidase [Thermoanaerobaculia bacterium]|nr:M56 family metallopeptidase [Thermoanaerobaculia bacterium]
MSAWSVTYLVHSTLMIAVVWIAAYWIRSASVRDTLWKLALVGGIVTATIQMSVPVERFLPETAPRRITVPMPLPAAPPAPALQSETRIELRDVPPSAPARKLPLLPTVWAALTALLIARIVVGRNRFLQTIRERVEILSGADRALVDRLAERAGLARAVRLTESGSVRSPLAMLGWEIVVPAGVLSGMTGEQRETILAHELAHLQRRDPLWLTLAEGVKAILCFQPLNWLVQAKMKETAEFLCDDAAVLQTGNRKALAETLAALAVSVSTPVPAVAAMAEGGSHLIARVTRVLRASGRPDSPLRLHVRLLLAIVVVVSTAAFAPGITMVVASSKALGGKPNNHFADGVLNRSFRGPDGDTNVQFEAHDAWISDDARDVRFDTRDGYVRAKEVSEHGPVREVEIKAGRSLEPVRRYTVDGVETAWCDDARRIIASAFGPSTEHAASTDTSKTHTWNATIEFTGARDGAPLHIQIRAKDVRYRDSGEVILDEGSSLWVLESVGNQTLSFDLRKGQNRFHSENHPEMTNEDRVEWLREMLRKHAQLPRKVIDSLTHI